MKMKYLLPSILSVMLLTGCSDFLDLNPKSEASVANFYKTPNDIQTAVNACYASLQGTYQYGEYFIALMELRADNVEDINPGGSAGMFYTVDNFTATSDNNIIRYSWKELYNQIYRCNKVLASMDVVTDASQRKQLEGEAYFLRALAYFNIVRLWGAAPMVLTPITTDEARNLTRNSIDELYTSIENDLKNAADRLPKKYATTELGKATSGAAKTLLGKVYLTQKKWSDALIALDDIITNYQDVYALQDKVADVFDVSKEMNAEIVFAVRYSKTIVGEGRTFNDYFKDKSKMSDDLKNNCYETTDERRAMIEHKRVDANNNVITKYYDTFDATTAKVGYDQPLLRYADVLLMYAEAKNEVGYEASNSGKAMTYLNMIRKRAKASELDVTIVNTQQAFRNAVLQERRLEFPFELHRWFDLIRTNTAIEAIKKVGYTITANDYLYPIPKTEVDIMKNPTGFPQNPGYN